MGSLVSVSLVYTNLASIPSICFLIAATSDTSVSLQNSQLYIHVLQNHRYNYVSITQCHTVVAACE